MKPIWLLLLLTLTIGLCSCHSREETSPGWLEAARRAQREGKTSVSFQTEAEPNEGGTLREVLRDATVVLATPQTRPPKVTMMPWYLLTWHVMHVDERLVTGRPSRPAWCALISKNGPEVGPAEMALALGGGTKVIEGVTFHNTTLDSSVSLSAGQQYLIFLRSCPNGQANLEFGVDSVHAISKDGTILPSFGGRRFAQELQAVGTVDRLRALIANLKLSGK